MKAKKTISWLVICALLAVGNLPLRISGQNLRQTTADARKSNAPENSPKADFKNIFAEELSKSKTKSANATIDFKAIEKAQYKKQTANKGNGWTRGEKIIFAAFVIGTTILVVLVAKYGKVPKCSDIYCPSGETCPCDE